MAVRGRFANSCDFLVAIASFAAGPFAFIIPSLLFFNGGACFILYMIVFGIIFAIPMASIEMSLGHISGLAPTATFAAISSPLRALGYIQAIACSFFTIFLGQRSAKFLGLTIASLFGSNVLTGCSNEWNDPSACKPFLQWYSCLKSGSNQENCIQRELYAAKTLQYPNETFTLMFVEPSLSFYAGGQFVQHFLPSDGSGIAVAVLILLVWLLVLAGTVIGPKAIGKLLYVLLFLPIFLLLLICLVISFIDDFKSPFSENLYEDNSIQSLLEPRFEKFQSIGAAIQSITYLLAGMGVYHTLASFHRHSETVNQPVRRWKVALIAPWVAFISMTVTGLIIGLIHFKSLHFLSHIESLSVRENELVTDQHFLSVPTAFALLNHGSIWTFLFYLALFLLCLGTMIPMFLSVVTSVVDDIHKLGGKKFLTAIALAIIHMILSQISFSDILKFILKLNSAFLEVLLLLFFITVGLFYGWHELQKDTILALGMQRSISGLKQFFSPASQYHTALLLFIGPLFIGIAVYDRYRGNGTHFRINFESSPGWAVKDLVILGVFGIILILVALVAIVDCIFLLNRKPILFSFLKRGFWNPLRYEAEEVGHKPPLGNDRVCWCGCKYSIALIFVLVLETISLLSAIVWLVLGIVFKFVRVDPTIISLYVLACIFSFWSLLGIFRARAQRSSDFLLPYLLWKMFALLIAPLNMFAYSSIDGHLSLLIFLSILILSLHGFLVAMVVGAHWHYRAKSLQMYNLVPMQRIISARVSE